MADDLEKRKRRILEAARKNPQQVRNAFAFAGFAGQIAQALIGMREPLSAVVLRAPDPPPCCPTCGHPALNPCRDPNGDWTWSCVEGCNP